VLDPALVQGLLERLDAPRNDEEASSRTRHRSLPFVYADEKTRTYYLIGSGGRLYRSPQPRGLDRPAFKGDNSGHGMLFRTFDGTLLFIVHHAEGKGPRKPQIWHIDDSGDKLLLKDRVGS
jgi:hypothetical protein